MTEKEYLARASEPTITGEGLEALWREIGSFNFPLGLTVATRIQHAIAKNPNLTQHLAKQCFGQLSTSLAENPALPLLFLENPTLAEDAAEETLLRMTRRSDSPKTLLEILTTHSIRQVREAARLHLAIYGEATEEQVRTELAALPIGGKEKLATLHAWKLVPGWLATHHKLKPAPESILLPQIEGKVNREPITEVERKELQELITYRPGTSQEDRERELDRLREIASQEGQKAEVLCLLGEVSWLRDWVKENPAAPVELLVDMRHWKRLVVRGDVPEEMRRFAAVREVDRTSSAGLVVVLAPAHIQDDDLLHESALSTRWIRRLGAALNPQLTEKDHKRLKDDANAIVRAVARDTALRDRIMEYGA